jgi:hypothetical protein
MLFFGCMAFMQAGKVAVMERTAAAKKRRILDAIQHQGCGKVPTMYRAEPSVNERIAS